MGEHQLGRSSWIRTNDLLLPKQALYQAELYSDGAGPIAAFIWLRNGRKRNGKSNLANRLWIEAGGMAVGGNGLKLRQNRAESGSCFRRANCITVRLSLHWGVAKW